MTPPMNDKAPNYDELLKAFLQDAVNKGQIQHFGYLLIPDDAQLNDQALFYLKADFKAFVAASLASAEGGSNEKV